MGKNDTQISEPEVWATTFPLRVVTLETYLATCRYGKYSYTALLPKTVHTPRTAIDYNLTQRLHIDGWTTMKVIAMTNQKILLRRYVVHVTNALVRTIYRRAPFVCQVRGHLIIISYACWVLGDRVVLPVVEKKYVPQYCIGSRFRPCQFRILSVKKTTPE